MIERRLIVDRATEQEVLWDFYDEVFRPINEETPLAQTYPKNDFLEFLVNQRVVKFIARDREGISGFGLITDQLDLEPWLSCAYFRRHYPDTPIRYIMAIAVRSEKRNSKMAITLLQALIDEVPEDGWGIFLHSTGVNPMIPRFADMAGRGYIEGINLDAETLCAYRWKAQKARLLRAG